MTGHLMKSEKAKLSKYKNNPLTTWLPAEDESIESVIQRLSGPEISKPSDEDRDRSARARLFLLEDLRRLHIVLPRELELEQEVAAIIREGYLDREPNALYWKNHNKESWAVMEAMKKPNPRIATCRTIAVIGTSACGKTASFDAILQHYPQLKIHDNRENPNLPVAQVVWLKFDFPTTGSPKALAKKMLQALGDLVGEDYAEQYGNGNADETLEDAVRLCREHFVGLIVVDEIQHATGGDHGWASRMMKFLISLSNELRLPLAFVGTPLAMARLQSRLASARRLIGITYDRFHFTPNIDEIKDPCQRARIAEENTEYLDFLQQYDSYLYINSKTKLSDLAESVYYYTQGILYFIVLLYLLAQRLVLLRTTLEVSRDEELTAHHLRSVYDEYFKPVDPVIQALRSGQESALENFEDLLKSFKLEDLLVKQSSLVAREQKRIARRVREASKKIEENAIVSLATTTGSVDKP